MHKGSEYDSLMEKKASKCLHPEKDPRPLPTKRQCQLMLQAQPYFTDISN